MASKINRSTLLLAALAATLVAAALGAVPASAARLAADCQPYAGQPCLFPYPDNRLTRPTHQRHRCADQPGRRRCRSTKGVRVTPGPYNRNDGFSPGSTIVLHIAGLDNQNALTRTGAVPLTNMGKSLAKRQPIVLIDESTGTRQLIWAELDANAKTAATRDLIIHPAKILAEGHTYVVALRNLRTAGGRLIPAPRWFARLRDGGRLPAAERSQRSALREIFKVLKRAGIARGKSLYEAWSFTVDSRQNLTDRHAGDPQQRVRAARRQQPRRSVHSRATRRRSR